MKKILVAAVSAIVGTAFGSYVTGTLSKTIIEPLDEQAKKILEYYKVLERWLALRQKDKTLVEYFRQNAYKKVAIYGMKELGERLFDELQASELEVVCIIDRDAQYIDCDVTIISPEDDIPDVDVIVVTASYYMESIEKNLKQKVDCPIVSINEVVYGI